MRKYFFPILLGGALLMSPLVAQAQTPAIGGIISYQGKLSQPNGQPIADGQQNVTFTFYEGGTAMTTPSPITMQVTTVGGIFNTFLGVGNLSLDPAKSYELGIKVGEGTEVKHAIAAVPMALNAKTAENAATAANATNFSGALVGDVTGTQGATTVAQVGGQSAADVATAATAVAAATSGNTPGTLVKRNEVGGVSLGAITSDNSFLATGTLNLDWTDWARGRIPVEGDGTRLIWYGSRAALRAGTINGTQWDDANMGYQSAAFGRDVRASGDHSFATGFNSTAAHTNSVAMGERTTASGASSVALGYYAHTSAKHGSFVFSDRSILDDGNGATDEAFRAQTTNTFNVRASGGYRLFSNSALTRGLEFTQASASLTTDDGALKLQANGDTEVWSNGAGTAGVRLPAGSGAWQNLSDRNAKQNIRLVNSREILRGVLRLPISTWSYKTRPQTRHIGAMAQDFYRAFKVGEDDKHISSIDPDGVALAAIQGLNAELEERDAKIKALKAELNTQNESFEARLKKLEAKR